MFYVASPLFQEKTCNAPNCRGQKQEEQQVVEGEGEHKALFAAAGITAAVQLEGDDAGKACNQGSQPSHIHEEKQQ